MKMGGQTKIERALDWAGLEKHLPALNKALDRRFHRKLHRNKRKDGRMNGTLTRALKRRNAYNKKLRAVVESVRKSKIAPEKFYLFCDGKTGKVLYRKAMTPYAAHKAIKQLQHVGIILKQECY